MATQTDNIFRSILPIPDRQHVGLTTYDAKDQDTKFPSIEPLRPPKGAPENNTNQTNKERTPL